MSSTTTLIPLPTPFWSATSNNPTCGATINDSPQNQTYCCNGLLLDITQGILGPAVYQSPFYFKDLRCCSGDPNVTLASVTFCTAGTQEELVTSPGSGGGSTSLGLTTTTSGNGGATRTSTTTTTERTSMTVSATATVKSEGSRKTGLPRMGYMILFLGILGVFCGY